jgi:hypothetical protein
MQLIDFLVIKGIVQKNRYFCKMKKKYSISFLVSFLSLTSFGFHKFYVAVYQINFAPERKCYKSLLGFCMNKALEKKYNKKHYIGTDKESPEDLVLLKNILRKT